jgi:hypothetical protein
VRTFRLGCASSTFRTFSHIYITHSPCKAAPLLARRKKNRKTNGTGARAQLGNATTIIFYFYRSKRIFIYTAGTKAVCARSGNKMYPVLPRLKLSWFVFVHTCFVPLTRCTERVQFSFEPPAKTYSALLFNMCSPSK